MAHDPEADFQELKRFLGRCGYNEEMKREFKNLSMRIARRLAREIPGGARASYNAGGIAVSGDITVHGDFVYVSWEADILNWILVRTCKGRKDYTGGRNQQYPFTGTWGGFVAKVLAVEKEGRALHAVPR